MKADRVSASALKTYEKCAFAYFLSYECNIKQPSTEKTTIGNVVHYALEMFANQDVDYVKNLKIKYAELKPYSLGKDYKAGIKTCNTCPFLKSGICDVLNQNVDQFEGCPKQSFEKCVKLTESVLNRKENPILRYKILGVEKEFRDLILNNANAVGFIDLITEMPNKIIEIRDWKTGSFIQKYDEVRNDIQVKLYDIAVKSMFPDYEGIIVVLDYIQGNEVFVTYTDEERENNKKQIEALIDKIKRDKTPCRRNNDWKCRYMCITREICDIHWAKYKNNGFKSEPEKSDLNGTDKK